jgi:hypothetical protein
LVVSDAHATVLRVAASWADALAPVSSSSATTAGIDPTRIAAGKSSSTSASSASASSASSADQSSAVALALIRRPSLGALFDLWTPLDLLPTDLRAAAVRMQSAATDGAHDSSTVLSSSSSSAALSSAAASSSSAATAAASRTAAQIEAESFVQQMLAVCSAFPAQTYALNSVI